MDPRPPLIAISQLTKHYELGKTLVPALQGVDLLPHRRLTQLQGRRRGQEAPLPGRLTQAPQLLKR